MPAKFNIEYDKETGKERYCNQKNVFKFLWENISVGGWVGVCACVWQVAEYLCS